MRAFILFLCACNSGPLEPSDEQTFRSTTITAKCEARQDANGTVVVTLDTPDSQFARLGGGSQYIVQCTVTTPMLSPPGAVQLTLQFGSDVRTQTNAGDATRALQSAAFRLDFPGRSGVFVDTDITGTFNVDNLGGGVLEGSASFSLTTVTEYNESGSYDEKAEKHTFSFTTRFPAKSS